MQMCYTCLHLLQHHCTAALETVAGFFEIIETLCYMFLTSSVSSPPFQRLRRFDVLVVMDTLSLSVLQL